MEHQASAPYSPFQILYGVEIFEGELKTCEGGGKKHFKGVENEFLCKFNRF